MVKGKNINFSARTINSLFGTPSIDAPGELQEFLEDHSPLDIICELISNNWLRFVSARLLPSSHTFEVTNERAIMIFAILTYVSFDIGHFLHKSIWNSAMGGLTVGLYHPSLITELCALGLKERVDRLADEVHHLQFQQEQQFAYQQQWWTLWADQMHIPISSRPYYPLLPNEPADPPPANMRDE
ncbi:hypothetical protein CDL12_11358 [Handroanthus impetiginosus]|uniref:Putative plant transposon protein domain-containing protein n=1 Tax=Handroanthus impetiginosus TaxID=429701 RepID=A0A2G9HFC1_9LAMI|nr:hypothetical protein CDL12_11358 [Handroanthus impetiginosus]